MVHKRRLDCHITVYKKSKILKMSAAAGALGALLFFACVVIYWFYIRKTCGVNEELNDEGECVCKSAYVKNETTGNCDTCAVGFKNEVETETGDIVCVIDDNENDPDNDNENDDTDVKVALEISQTLSDRAVEALTNLTEAKYYDDLQANPEIGGNTNIIDLIITKLKDIEEKFKNINENDLDVNSYIALRTRPFALYYNIFDDEETCKEYVKFEKCVSITKDQAKNAAINYIETQRLTAKEHLSEEDFVNSLKSLNERFTNDYYYIEDRRSPPKIDSFNGNVLLDNNYMIINGVSTRMAKPPHQEPTFLATGISSGE